MFGFVMRAYEVGFNTNENEETYICGFDDGDGGGMYSRANASNL